jgi:hypothetical protein
MSRIVILVIIYHRHKSIDSVPSVVTQYLINSGGIILEESMTMKAILHRTISVPVNSTSAKY